ncbi:MAG: winged helix-turn-helix transcriptional regulator [Alphaproteobacteria bacterium]|nr:winged helix-turn-helix transcriptional regulator [Alphaproteobacteria bacterium]
MKYADELIYSANVLKALGNPKRLQVVYFLYDGEKNVGALEKMLGISQSALSQHLSVLRAADIVSTRREAQSVYYSLNKGRNKKLLDAIRKVYA